MDKYERAATLKISRDFLAKNCLWKGKPNMLPYIIVNRRMLSMIIITIVLFSYFKFSWFLPTKLWSVFFLICLMACVIDWIETVYYITDLGLIVKKYSRYYTLEWKDVRQKEYRIRANPIEVLFGCRTIQYGKYSTGTAKENHLNIWWNTTVFWCIKDYKKVIRMISSYLDASKEH